MPIPRRFGSLRTLAALAGASMLVMTTVPMVAAEDPTDYVTDFAIVSTTIDRDTDIPTITYTFGCLQHVDFLRLRSQLSQVHAGTTATSYQQSFETSCEAGMTITLSVDYGLQVNPFRHGRADLSAWLEAYIGTFTVDTETITATVKLSPAHGNR